MAYTATRTCRIVTVALAATLTAILLTLPAAPAEAQTHPKWRPERPSDIEYPNTPSARARMAADPTAYHFKRALFSVTEQARLVREMIASGRMSRASAEASGMKAAVQGTFHFPVIAGTFAPPDSVESINLTDLNSRLWTQNYSDASMHHGSVRDYYEEVSYGRLTMTGDMYGWVRADSTVDHYVDQAGNEQDGFFDWLTQMITTIDTSGVDFADYDADDDGYVDTILFVHNLVGAEAQNVYGGTTGFWSHRWAYSSVNYYTSLGGTGSAQPYVTNDPDPVNGGYIKIDDYVIQPALNSDGSTMIDIGVFAHELGHAFGLPDYYDINGATDGSSEGLGEWCLMASGSYQESFSPVHMAAPAKLQMGWVTPLELTDADSLGIMIPRVEDNEFIIKLHTAQMNAQEYFLIENRQPYSFDQYLHGGGGLLIYHINDQVTTLNKVATDLRWAVEQADGLFDLENDNDRGDSGDPWPGSTNNTWFSATSTPDSKTRAGLDSYVEISILSASQDTMQADILGTPSFLTEAPSDGAYVNTLTPLLDWESYTNATWGTIQYEVAVDTTSTFASAAALFDTTSSDTLTWTGPLTEGTIYHWRVRAFDDMANERLNQDGTRTFIVDATLPIITVGALRNPVAQDNLDLYVIANETLASVLLQVDGSGQSLTPVSASGSYIQTADYTLSGPGTVDLHAEGTDLAGNSAVADASPAAAAASAARSTSMQSPDGRLDLLVPAGSVSRDGLTVILERGEPETGPIQVPRRRALESAADTSPLGGRALSPQYWVDVPSRVPGRKVQLTVRWNEGEVAAGERPALWQRAETGWRPVETAVDLTSLSATAQVEELGLFQLRVGSDRIIAPMRDLELEPAWPNPFNPSTQIAFTLPEPSRVSLKVFNARGQLVRTLVDGQQPAGRQVVTWNGRNSTGQEVASGIYLYVLETPAGVRSRKVTLIR